MSSHRNSTSALVDNRLGTKIKVHTVTNIWTIENFRFHEAIGENLTSSVFSAIDDNDTKWCLKLTPNRQNNEKDNISFYVWLNSENVVHEVAFAELSACILDQATQETSFQKSEKIQKFITNSNLGGLGGKSWGGWSNFQEKDDNFINNLLIIDTLTIKCVITYSIPSTVKNTLNQRNNTTLYPSVPECNLSQHFGLLLENHSLADVILLIKGNEYPAHKVILAARSPVFAAMFKHDAKENEENRVYIEDMDEEVVCEMLRYIYTGKCEKLPELAYGLLAAGDKYDLDHLKKICADELYKNLWVENAASILALADMHGVEELRNEVIKFIVSKHTEVLDTEGWKSIRSVDLIKEVCLALARQCQTTN